MTHHTDALGRAIILPEPPRRIISLVPSLTELLSALSLDEAVVGLTRYCVHPEGWTAQKTIVGGTKKVRLARAAELKPDLIIANKEENTKKDVEALEALAPVYVTDVADLDSAMETIRALGSLVGRLEEATELVRRIETGFEMLPTFAPRRAAYLIWQNPIMAAGGGTFIHDMMRRGGLENVFGDLDRYPQTPIEALREAKPDLVLLSSEPYPFDATHIESFAEALPHADVRLVDGELFSWYGPRLLGTPEALRALA